MANYAERDRRERETAEWVRRVRIADRIVGLGAIRMEGMALWLFCPWCGYRRLADDEWFFRRAVDGPDPLAAFRAKLRCGGCRRRDVVTIFAPAPLRALPIKFFAPEGRALLLSDED